MDNQPFTVVYLFGNYGITYFDNRFGVCKNGVGKVKYMPVNWKLHAPYYFPELHKTCLSMMDTAEGLYNNILTCAKLKTSIPECIQVCEHVLRFGRTPR